MNKKYRDKDPSANKLLTQNVRIGLDGKKHRRNLNILVCGGSGAGKTRFFCKPNAMQCKLLNISDLQMSYITNVGAGQGLLKVGSSLVPFVNKFPRNTELYKLMTTKFGEV